MIKSTYHVGFGVTNDERTTKFYQKYLNFGKPRVTIEDDSVGEFGAFVGAGVRYRWSMLTHNVGSVEFEPVQLISRKPKILAKDYQWGDIGFTEACFQVEGLHQLYEEFKKEKLHLLCPPQKIILGEGRWAKDFFYLEDPDGIHLKFEQDFKAPKGAPTVLGYHYLCVGVTDISKSLRFYKDLLGYHRVLWDIEGHLEWMDPVCGGRVNGHSVMLGSDFDQCLLQLVQVFDRQPRYLMRDTSWGDVGLAEICLRVFDIEKLCEDLQKKNVKILVPPSPASPQMDYAIIAYAADPDGNYVEFSIHKKK